MQVNTSAPTVNHTQTRKRFSTPHEAVNFRAAIMTERWHPTREAAYAAVIQVCQGKCAAQIAQALFGNREPGSLMRVERLLQYAAKMGVLTVRSTTNDPLQQELTARFGPPHSFHVINNDQVVAHETRQAEEAFRADMISRHAAEVVAERLARLLLEKGPRKAPLVIANAGGISVSGVVRHLAAHKRIPETANPAKLLFVSLNAASMPTNYGYSANALAVQMAEIYGGRHIALSRIWPARVKAEYDKASHDIDLLICGAGAHNGLLFTWLRSEAHIQLPDQAVGDICLIPLSAEGEALSLGMNGPDHVRKILAPSPTFAELKALASRDGVILVVCGYQADDPPADSSQPTSGPLPHPKLAVTRAILKGGLAYTTILGADLARDLVNSP